MMRYLIALNLVLFASILRAQPTVTLRLDPDNSRGGSASQVFDSIEFIPLETTKESLFGSIDQLEVTDSLFIILDIRSNSILFFHRNGKFYTKITTGGGSKYFYNFTLDRSAGEIAVMNNFTKGLLVYDLRGKFLRKPPSPDLDEVITLYRFPGNITLYNLRRSASCVSKGGTLYDLRYTRGFDSIIRNLKPYNSRSENAEFSRMSNAFNFSGEEGSCMFSMPFDYSLYQFNDTGLLRKYQFIFPLLYSLPANFATDGAYCKLRAKYAYSTPGYESTITALERGYRFGDYLLFSTFNRKMLSNGDYNYAYNLKTGSLISFTRVTADSSSYYLPILSSAFEIIGTVYHGNIFSSVASFKLFAIKNELDKKVTYPKSLEAYFANGSKKDNSVIVQFKLKPGI
jgi:hypothetical protein